jgi:hypothetical protein
VTLDLKVIQDLKVTLETLALRAILETLDLKVIQDLRVIQVKMPFGTSLALIAVALLMP